MAEDFQKRDIFRLSEKELKSHINEVLSYRTHRPDWISISANECNYLAMLAHGELQNRSAARTAKIAIAISVVSALISLVSVAL